MRRLIPELRVCRPAIRRQRRYPDLVQNLARIQRRGEQIHKEIIRPNRAMPPCGTRNQLRPQRDSHRRQIPRRIRMRQRAADSPHIANLSVRNLSRRVSQRRRPLPNQIRRHQRGIRRHSPDSQPAAVRLSDIRHIPNLAQIDQHRRLGKPQLHQRYQAMPARQQLRLIPMLRQQTRRLCHASRRVIRESA